MRLLTLCTGNATRSVIAAALLRHHLPGADIATAGTLTIDGQPISWRTRAGFEAISISPPPHRSTQVTPGVLDSAELIIAAATEHVAWVRRCHPRSASRTSTLRRLVRDLDDGDTPLGDRVAALGLADVELQEWEDVADPGGQEVEAFIACAHELRTLVDDLAPRLRGATLSG